VNRVRGRRALAIPEDVGPLELAAFVLLPAVVQLAVHGGWGISVLVANLVLLALVALTFGFGLGSIVVWAARRLTRQLARSLSLLARAVPLLLFFALVLFLTTEVWQVFADRDGGTLIAVGALLVLVAVGFVLARLPREVERIERGSAAIRQGPPLRRMQRANVGLVLLISHGLQIVVVTVAVAAFFVALGMLVIDADVLRAWIGRPGDALLAVEPLGVPLRLTTELLQVAGAIAALSGLYFAISVLTDQAYRDEFLAELTEQMESTFAERDAYLALRAEEAG
jgi:hypothetical protein